MDEVKYCVYCGCEIENKKDKKCKNCGKKILKQKGYALRVIVYSIIGSFFMLFIWLYISKPSMITPEAKIRGKLIPAVRDYNIIAEKYMKDNNKKDLSGAFGENCDKASNYFEILSGSGCNFITNTGVYWEIDSKTGNAAVSDVDTKYSILLWTNNGIVSDDNNKPNNLKYPSIKSQKGVFTWQEYSEKSETVPTI